MESYSPVLGRAVNATDGVTSWTGPFDLSYDLQSAVADWTTLGTVAVPGGVSSAPYSWTGIDPGASYQWYATVSDGVNTVTTPVQRFSTAGDPSDITSQVAVSTSGFVYNRAAKSYSGTLTITNPGQSTFSGQLSVALNGLPAGVTLLNSSGSTAGVPYLNRDLSQGLAPGAAVSIPLQFANSGNAKITFLPSVTLQQ